MSERKKSWMRQNNKWMQKWNIYLNACPTNSEDLKSYVMEKFHKHIWGNELGRKKKYYAQEFNPTCDLQQKECIGANIPWRAKILIAQIKLTRINYDAKQVDGEDLKKLGKSGCVLFSLLGQ